MSAFDLWRFFPLGYLFSILIETPILIIGLSRRHSIKRRLVAGVWLTACTYPIVVLVMPLLFGNTSRAIYLIVAEQSKWEGLRCGRTSRRSWSRIWLRFSVAKC